MDTGPIYVEKRFALDADITSDELLSELAELGVEAVAETLNLIEKGVRPHPQSSGGATRALKISKSEAHIDRGGTPHKGGGTHWLLVAA